VKLKKNLCRKSGKLRLRIEITRELFVEQAPEPNGLKCAITEFTISICQTKLDPAHLSDATVSRNPGFRPRCTVNEDNERLIETCKTWYRSDRLAQSRRSSGRLKPCPHTSAVPHHRPPEETWDYRSRVSHLRPILSKRLKV